MSSMPGSDSLLNNLLSAPRNSGDQELAVRYAPVLQFDAHEPFTPLAAGYTIFRADAPSPSFPRHIRLAPPDRPPAALAIEYAIWWDWDIEHLYELEHVWIYVDTAGQIVRCEASWHGGYHEIADQAATPMIDGRALIYSEPGKHAFAPTPDWFKSRWANVKRQSSFEMAGRGGVWVTPLFEQQLRRLRTPRNNTLVRTHLQRHAFRPDWNFSQAYRFDRSNLVPWSELHEWIPRRVAWWLDNLNRDTPLSQYRFLSIGHRGASAHAPGNSLAAIRKAAELGADAVEIDLRMTADDQPVIVHDPFLVDPQGNRLPIGASSLAQLRTVDLGNGERIPTLDEVIALCRDERLGMYIEVKTSSAIPALVTAHHQYGLENWAVIASFRPDWLAEIKAWAPSLPTSILFNSVHVDASALAHSVRADYVHPCWERFPAPGDLLTPEWMSAVRQADLGVICWHEERPAEIAKLRQAGVDGICSDAPELLV